MERGDAETLSLSVYYEESLTGLLIAQHCLLRCCNLYHFLEYLCIVVVLKCVADRQIGVNTYKTFRTSFGVALILYSDECFYHTLWPLSGVCALNKQETEYCYQTPVRHLHLNICSPITLNFSP